LCCSRYFLCCSMYCLFCDFPCIVCVYMCTEQLPPGGYPIAVKFIISYIIHTHTQKLKIFVHANVTFPFFIIMYQYVSNKSASCKMRIRNKFVWQSWLKTKFQWKWIFFEMEIKHTDKNNLHWTNCMLLCNENFKACNIWHTLMACFTILYWFSLWQMFKVATYKTCCIAQSTCLVSNLTTLQELKPRYAIMICQCKATSMSKTKIKQNYVVRFQLLLLCHINMECSEVTASSKNIF
jgi:hypothetical protein